MNDIDKARIKFEEDVNGIDYEKGRVEFEKIYGSFKEPVYLTCRNSEEELATAKYWARLDIFKEADERNRAKFDSLYSIRDSLSEEERAFMWEVGRAGLYITRQIIKLNIERVKSGLACGVLYAIEQVTYVPYFVAPEPTLVVEPKREGSNIYFSVRNMFALALALTFFGAGVVLLFQFFSHLI
jgi:hypothetical protein